ncbi:hypothetical protein ACP70R_019573 [Stipagrostis hirtigluma subsp. patula]
MEPSQKRLYAAVILLLVFVMAAEMGQVQARECTIKSKTFKGLCLFSDDCAEIWRQEDSSYPGGRCSDLNFTCLCITPCKPAVAPAA